MKAARIFLLLVIFKLIATAQNAGTGIPAFGSFTGGTRYDIVNNQNLNAHLMVPFTALAGRGTNFNFAQINDSKIWTPATSGGTKSWLPIVDSSGNPTWGWQTATPTGSTSVIFDTIGTCSTIISPGIQVNVPLYHVHNWIYTDVQGTQHAFPSVDLTDICQNNQVVRQPTGSGNSFTGYASDPSGFFINANTLSTSPTGVMPTGLVTGLDGVRYYGFAGGGFVEDRNGNFLSNSVQGSTVLTWTNTTGQLALTVTKSANAIQYTDANGNSVATVNLQTLNIQTNFGCSGVIEYSGAATVPSSISLPNGQSFSFTYETTPGNSSTFTGRLKTVTLPYGGSYEYDYPGANDGINCADGSTLQLTRKVSDGTNTRSWTFVRSGSTTTLTAPQLSYDPAGNDIVYAFDGNGHETSRKIYQGSSSGTQPTLLRTVNTTWTANGTPATSVEILEDGVTQAETDTSYDSNGILQSTSFYDFGNGGHGALLKSISFSYLAASNSNYAAPRNLLNLVSEIQIKDANGTVQNRMRSNFDESGTMTSCPTGVPQHDDSSYGCSFLYRGNLTSVLTYKDPVTPANPVTRSSTNDFFGNILTASLDAVRQSSATFSHTTNYSYPDSVTYGPSGGPQFTNSYTYNNVLGQLASIQDANGQTTQYGYDTLGRISTITRPDLAQISYGYNDSAHTITRTSPVDGSHSIQKTTALDPLDRVLTTSVADGTGNVFSIIQNQYDEVSRLSGTSNPYTGASPSFFSTIQFDALGRTRKLILPDGQQSVYSYSLQTEIFTDPTGKQIQNKADALGRLTEVDLPNLAAGTGGASATAAVVISGSLNGLPAGGGAAPLAAANSPLTSFVASDGSSHAFYISTNRHVWHLFWNSTAGWQNQDLTAITGETLAASNTSLASSFDALGDSHVFYEDGNQHVHELFCCPWQDNDLTAITGNTLAASGSALSSFTDVQNGGIWRHVFYLGTNQHVYHLFGSSTSNWINQDLTAITGSAAAAAGSALSSFADSTTERVFYVGANQHVYQLSWVAGRGFGSGFGVTSDYSDAQGWNVAPYYSSLRMADVNGDGKPDVCGRGSTGVSCSLNNGNLTFAPLQLWESNMSDAHGWGAPQYGITDMLGDLNRDGKADVCGRGASGIQCELSNGTSFATTLNQNGQYTDAGGWNAVPYYGSLRLADVNGDGKLDLCGKGQAGNYCSLGNGDGTFGPVTAWDSNVFQDSGGWSAPQYGTTMMFADINGDGKADVCGRGAYGIVCELSTGSGFGPAYLATQDYSDAQGWNAVPYYGSLRLVDVNGDGKADICGRGGAGISCSLNNGSGSFGPAQLWETGFSDAEGWGLAQYGTTMMFADINGDGKTDVCGRGGSGIGCELNNGNLGWQNQDLTAITGNTLAGTGTGLTGYVMSSGNPVHLHYVGANQHVYHLYISVTTGAWVNEDLTAATGALAAAGSAMTSVPNNSNGSVRLYFLDGNQHLNETYCGPGQCWTNTDMTVAIGATPASGSKLTSFGLSQGNPVHVHYEGSNQHIWHMVLSSAGGWTNQDTFSIATVTLPDSGTVGLTVGDFTASVCFGPSTNPVCSGQQGNSTSGAVAAALAQALNASSSPVTATSSGSTLNLTWKNVGPNTTPINPLATIHDNPGSFPNPSFTSPATQFTNGAYPGITSTATTTTYTLNVLDQITGINQAGQTRSAVYDNLGRMTSYTTPETGTVTFQYNDFNLVTQSTDARNVVTNFTFDGLNRLTGQSYTVPGGSGITAMPNVCDPNNGASPTANVCLYYDQGGSTAFALNQLTTIVDSSGSEAFAYDKLGRMTQRQKSVTGTNGGNAYVTQYQYNLGNELTQITYPSGRQVKPAYDGLGRLTSIADATTTYASNFAYNTAQQMTGFTYGNGITASYGYSTDGRLQLSSLKHASTSQTFVSLSYGYSGQGGNNGQITRIIDNVDNGRSVSYLYDALGRLQEAYTAGSASYPNWDLAFSYDAYGNRTDETPQPDTSPNITVPSNHVTINTAKNQIATAGYGYDAAGNMTNDGVNTLAYDGGSHVVSSSFGSTTTSYIYDGAGVRVRKCQPNCSTPNSSTVYIFSGNQPIAEYDNAAAAGSPSREYIYAPAGLLATIDSAGTKYHLRDHLSPRVTTNSAGTKLGEQGLFPFGESWYSANTTSKLRFTTYENDPESGNDYAMARYYISRLCRFNSPDAFGGSVTNPRSLNRYSYVMNDPINHVDPLGLAPMCNMTVLARGGNLSDLQRRQLQAEMNRIFSTGGADVHIDIVTSGPADYTLDINPTPAHGGPTAFGVTLPPVPTSSSELYTNRIDAVGPTTDIHHSGWPYQGPTPAGDGSGIVYGRIASHEMAGHGMLGYSHADPGDSNRGFLGNGPQSSDALFKVVGNPNPNEVFSFSDAQGLALHVLCIIRTQKFATLPGGGSGGFIIDLRPILPLPPEPEECGDDCGGDNQTPTDENGRPQLVCGDPNGCGPDVQPPLL